MNNYWGIGAIQPQTFTHHISMSALNIKDDDDEELGAYIYQTSHTAKLFREKEEAAALVVLASSSYQTHRKSPRLLATKSKQQDILQQ